jgi:ribosomal-protein-alanine N-acetyltransferase
MDLSKISRQLETRDLHLRPSRMEDAEGMFTMLSDPESMKYWSDPPVTDIKDAIRVLREGIESDAKGNSLCWSVLLSDQGEMIGKCILFNFSQKNHRAEIGYILNRDYWGQGLMRQALEAVIEFAFNTLNLHRIEADVDTENIGSLVILEKLGFEREGLFRDRWYVYGEWQDSIMLGLLNK